MTIVSSNYNDLPEIFRLYEVAVAYQKTKFHQHWQPFDRQLIETEIKEGRQWKILVGGTIACIFATAFNDPFIWGEKDKEPSLYIHRIVTNPVFRGNHYVRDIIAWAKAYGKETGKQYVRIDTWGDNQQLIQYYII